MVPGIDVFSSCSPFGVAGMIAPPNWRCISQPRGALPCGDGERTTGGDPRGGPRYAHAAGDQVRAQGDAAGRRPAHHPVRRRGSGRGRHRARRDRALARPGGHPRTLRRRVTRRGGSPRARRRRPCRAGAGAGAAGALHVRGAARAAGDGSRGAASGATHRGRALRPALPRRRHPRSALLHGPARAGVRGLRGRRP